MPYKLILACVSCALLTLAAVTSRLRPTVSYSPSDTFAQNAIDEFPAPPNLLAKERDEKNVSAIRHHAWNLLEQLGQDDKRLQPETDRDEVSHLHPAWESWFTKCSQLQLSKKCDPANGFPGARALEPRVEGAPQKEPPMPPQYSSVYYRPKIAEWILKADLNHVGSLNHADTLFKNPQGSWPRARPHRGSD